MKMTAFCDMVSCSLVEVDRHVRGAYRLHHQGDEMMEAVRISESSVYFNETTRRYIPESCHLQTFNSLRRYDIAQNYRILHIAV
jgi:hypothetical protein